MHGLRGVRVVDFTTGIAGPYCTKLFADAGAEVVLVEPRGAASERTPLFRFLHASKRAVTGAPGGAHVADLVASADLVVEDFAASAPLDRAALLARHPSLVLCSISPYGLTGPYASRPATEFTIQAECGSIAVRGRPGLEPYQAGGRVTYWFGGVMAAVAAAGAVHRARTTGHGEHVDVSLQEAMALATTTYADLSSWLMGRAKPPFAGHSIETPSIEPTADGFVGFNTNTAQQFSDILLMIERPDLRESHEFDTVVQRLTRLAEWEAIVHAFTRRHTTAEIIEQAALLRIPVSPVCSGETVLEHLALSIETDAQWRALLGALAAPAWATGFHDASLAERRAAHAKLDEALRAHFAARELGASVAQLLAAGVPAAEVQDARFLSEHPQIASRGFCERVPHPVVGDLPIMTVPFRYASVSRWLQRAEPTLGQHNHELLGELGYGDAQVAELEAERVIGTRPIGV
ncbi:MAG: CoA transferase [Deltaproteobacteria bacterium]|nr:CoA transferase [Deltaproteobacteria bacterium]